MLVLFLDESGDHSLSKIDPQYPIFVLGGCVFDYDYYKAIVENLVKQFKEKLFGRTDLIIHTADISRNKEGFERLKDPVFRKRFYEEINRLMEELDYKVIACVIKKDKHLLKYGLEAKDPYLLSLDIVVERFIFMLRENNTKGIIVAESRNDVLDNQLELAFLNLKIRGTYYISGTEIKRQVTNFTIKSKDENIAGLQIADLVVSPVGRFVLGKEIHQDFKIIERKFRRDNLGNYMGYGLVILPRNK